MKRVIITGANGFIGSHIAAQFCKNNIPVGCFVREHSSSSNLKDLQVEYLYGDIRILSSLEKAFKGYDVVIHNAAFAGDWGDYDLFYTTNVLGTHNVMKACIRNNINHIILTGSCSSYGEENNRIAKNESSPYNPRYHYFLDTVFPCRLNFYRETKALATKEAIHIAEKNNLNLTILEPVWVYGEREFSSGFFEYMKSVKEGLFVVPGTKKNKFHVIYAEDCARAFYLAYKKRIQGVERILIGNQETASMWHIYSSFLDYAGLQHPLLLPKWLIYPGALILELIYIIFKMKNPPLLTRGRVNMFYDNIEYSVTKAEKLLGFKNYYSLEEGIRRTVVWYKQHNLI